MGNLGWEGGYRIEFNGKFGDGTCKGIGSLKSSLLQLLNLGRESLNLGFEGLVCGFELGKTLVDVRRKFGGFGRLRFGDWRKVSILRRLGYVLRSCFGGLGAKVKG